VQGLDWYESGIVIDGFNSWCDCHTGRDLLSQALANEEEEIASGRGIAERMRAPYTSQYTRDTMSGLDNRERNVSARDQTAARIPRATSVFFNRSEKLS
jgi:hypothetical protein